MSSTPRHPFYTAPNLTPFDDSTGRVDVEPVKGGLTLTLGSDLVLVAQPDASGPWLISAVDADANHLATLAVVLGGGLLTEAVAQAATTARALFPNHLFTEI